MLMRKLYTLLTTLLLGAASLSAALPISGQKQLPQSLQLPAAELGVSAVQELPQGAMLTQKAATPRFATLADMAGEYTWTCRGLLNSMPQEVSTTATVEVSGGEVSIVMNMSGIEVVLKGTADLESGTLTVPSRTYVTEDPDGPIYLYFKEADSSGNILDGATEEKTMVATIGDNSITFPRMSIWALGDFDNEALGFYWMSYVNVFTKVSENTGDTRSWSKWSDGTFVDGWIVPAMGIEPIAISCSIEKCDDVSDLYRLNCPYSSPDFPMPSSNEGYIEFSLADPAFVTVLPGVFSGFMNGPQPVYCFNFEGFAAARGYDRAMVVEQGIIAEEDLSTYADGVVTINNCVFDFTEACGNAYTWQNSEGESLADKMFGSITFDKAPVLSGLETVDSASNAPVEYYNLQGVRVENPANGQIVIRRQGTTAQKVLIMR